MNKEALAVMPEIKKVRGGIPMYYRERMSKTTLADFKSKLKRMLDVIDEEDEQMPVSMLVEQRYREISIACWTGAAFIRLTIDNERRF